jgi:hypothetical protein
MAIIVYNIKTDDYTSHPNNFYIGRPSVLSNPFTHDGKRSNLAKLSFKTREEALEAYELYFEKMIESDKAFQDEFNKIYEKYKNGEDVYLGCFCPKSLRCHGDVIIEKLQQRLIKEKLKERKDNFK